MASHVASRFARHPGVIGFELFNEPVANPADLSRPLFRWEMNAGERRAAVVRIPVPGYVVAPAAPTVESTPCVR